MSSTFNPQILVEKLAKLNNSQQSIETLSHWCIFHMNKAKQIVETWDRQFHSSPCEQRLAFLYLANDILQNSRRKGAEFVGEFWRVLPEALRDVIHNGDDFGRTAALRLINIWDERKVFGSRGHILKEEFVERLSENSSKNRRQFNLKLKQSVGNTMDKIVSSYEVIYGGQLDEVVVLSRCRNAISCVEKVEKDIGGDESSGQSTEFLKELQGHHTVLRECIEQLTSFEASRATLVSYLREALHEQEFKLDQYRNQLQAAQLQSERAANICQQLLNSSNVHLLDDQGLQELSTTHPGGEQISLLYTKQLPFPEKFATMEDDNPQKSATAAVAAKLTASTSSAQMLTYVLSSLTQEGVISSVVEESPSDIPSEKRPKLENDQSYVPPSAQPPPLPLFPYPDATQQNAPTSNQQPTPDEQLPPPSSSLPLPLPLPLPLLPPMPPHLLAQFMKTASPTSNVQYNYGAPQQPALPLRGCPPVGPPELGMIPYAPAPANTNPAFLGPEDSFYSQLSSMPMAPISHE